MRSCSSIIARRLRMHAEHSSRRRNAAAEQRNTTHHAAGCLTCLTRICISILRGSHCVVVAEGSGIEGRRSRSTEPSGPNDSGLAVIASSMRLTGVGLLCVLEMACSNEPAVEGRSTQANSQQPPSRTQETVPPLLQPPLLVRTACRQHARPRALVSPRLVCIACSFAMPAMLVLCVLRSVLLGCHRGDSHAHQPQIDACNASTVIQSVATLQYPCPHAEWANALRLGARAFGCLPGQFACTWRAWSSARALASLHIHGE